MAPADVIALLEGRFGSAITGKKLDAIDPWAVVDVGRLVDVCEFLRDDQRLQFDLLNCISGVDYLEPDPKKAPKAGFEPHEKPSQIGQPKLAPRAPTWISSSAVV